MNGEFARLMEAELPVGHAFTFAGRYWRVEQVDPPAARRLLAGDRHPVDPARVARLAAVMRAGAWELPTNRTLTTIGRPLVFSLAGRVLDGHHRLAAIVACGRAQTFIVQRPARPAAPIPPPILNPKELPR